MGSLIHVYEPPLFIPPKLRVANNPYYSYVYISMHPAHTAPLAIGPLLALAPRQHPRPQKNTVVCFFGRCCLCAVSLWARSRVAKIPFPPTPCAMPGMRCVLTQ